MTLTLKLNFKLVFGFFFVGVVAWAVARYLVSPLVSAGAMGFWASITLGSLFIGGILVGNFESSWIHRRMWRHYWLCQGYTVTAAEAKLVEAEDLAKTAMRSGKLFKGWTP